MGSASPGVSTSKFLPSFHLKWKHTHTHTMWAMVLLFLCFKNASISFREHHDRTALKQAAWSPWRGTKAGMPPPLPLSWDFVGSYGKSHDSSTSQRKKSSGFKLFFSTCQQNNWCLELSTSWVPCEWSLNQQARRRGWKKANRFW